MTKSKSATVAPRLLFAGVRTVRLIHDQSKFGYPAGAAMRAVDAT